MDIFEQLDVDTSTELTLFKGLALVEAQRDSEALSFLTMAAADSNYMFQEDAIWYALLISVKMNKKKEIKQFIEQLIQYDGRFKEEALAIRDILFKED